MDAPGALHPGKYDERAKELIFNAMSEFVLTNKKLELGIQ